MTWTLEGTPFASLPSGVGAVEVAAAGLVDEELENSMNRVLNLSHREKKARDEAVFCQLTWPWQPHCPRLLLPGTYMYNKKIKPNFFFEAHIKNVAPKAQRHFGGV